MSDDVSEPAIVVHVPHTCRAATEKLFAEDHVRAAVLRFAAEHGTHEKVVTWSQFPEAVPAAAAAAAHHSLLSEGSFVLRVRTSATGSLTCRVKGVDEAAATEWPQNSIPTKLYHFVLHMISRVRDPGGRQIALPLICQPTARNAIDQLAVLSPVPFINAAVTKLVWTRVLLPFVVPSTVRRPPSVAVIHGHYGNGVETLTRSVFSRCGFHVLANVDAGEVSDEGRQGISKVAVSSAWELLESECRDFVQRYPAVPACIIVSGMDEVPSMCDGTHRRFRRLVQLAKAAPNLLLVACGSSTSCASVSRWCSVVDIHVGPPNGYEKCILLHQALRQAQVWCGEPWSPLSAQPSDTETANSFCSSPTSAGAPSPAFLLGEEEYKGKTGSVVVVSNRHVRD